MTHTLRHQWQENDIVVFTHIQKTAGTSLSAILHKQFDQEKILEVRALKYPEQMARQQAAVKHRLMRYETYLEVKNEPDKHFGQYKLIRGHMPYDPPPFRRYRTVYITILRDPIRRVFSSYEHMRSHDDNPFHEELQSLDFNDFILNEKFHWFMDNWMCTSLTRKKFTTEDDFQDALNILESMTYVGLTEHFDTSMLLLHYVFGWPYNFETLHLNRAKKDYDYNLTSEAKEIVQRLTYYDQRLYDHAVVLFNERIQRLAAELFKENMQLRQQLNPT